MHTAIPTPPHSPSRRPDPRRPLAIALLLAGTALALPARATLYQVHAAGFGTVQTNGVCTFREAMLAAATNTASADCPAGTSSDTIRLLDTGAHSLTNGQLTLSFSGTIRIEGTGASPSDTWIDMGWSNRFATLASGRLEVADLVLQLGDAGAGNGGIFDVANGTLALSSVSLILGRAGHRGGCINFQPTPGSTAQVVIERSVVLGCRARGPSGPAGGGIFADLDGVAELHIDASIIQGNLAETTNSLNTPAGGGVGVLARISSAFVISNTRLLGNRTQGSSLGWGGALSVAVSDTATGLLERVVVEGNEAGTSGSSSHGLDVGVAGDGGLLLDGLEVRANDEGTSTGRQMTLRTNDNGAILVRNALVADSTCDGLFVSTNSPTSSVTLSHLTVAGNGDIGLQANATSPVHLWNTIVAANGTDLVNIGFNHEANMIGGNPGFENAAAGDYRLTAASPARDTGNSGMPDGATTDLPGFPRVLGPETDKGAYEHGGIFRDGFEWGDVSAW